MIKSDDGTDDLVCASPMISGTLHTVWNAIATVGNRLLINDEISQCHKQSKHRKRDVKLSDFDYKTIDIYFLFYATNDSCRPYKLGQAVSINSCHALRVNNR